MWNKQEFVRVSDDGKMDGAWSWQISKWMPEDANILYTWESLQFKGKKVDLKTHTDVITMGTVLILKTVGVYLLKFWCNICTKKKL